MATDASGEKAVTGTSERREPDHSASATLKVCRLTIFVGIVSTMTIRNDGVSPEKQGIAVRAYGGALICDSTTPSVAIFLR